MTVVMMDAFRPSWLSLSVLKSINFCSVLWCYCWVTWSAVWFICTVVHLSR